jgi:hypothetical protein
MLKETKPCKVEGGNVNREETKEIMLRESRPWKIERRNAEREESTKLDRRNGLIEGNPEKLQEK